MEHPVAVPQTFLGNPILTAKDLMEITGLKKSTAYNKIRFEMKRYEFGRRVFVRLYDFQNVMERSWEGPSG